MDISSEDKIKLESSFVATERGNRIEISREGVWTTYDDESSFVKVLLKVVEERDNGYVLEAAIVSNPKDKEYFLYTLQDEIFQMKFLDSNLSIIKEVPTAYWKLSNDTAEQVSGGSRGDQ